MEFKKALLFSLASSAALAFAGFGSISARADERGCNNNVHLTQSGGVITLTPVEPDYYCDFDFDSEESYLDFDKLDPGIGGATKFIFGSDAELWEEGAGEAYYDFRSANYSFEVEGPVGGFSDEGFELTIVDSDVPELVLEGSVVARSLRLRDSEFGLIENNAYVSSVEDISPAIFTIENSTVDRFVNNGFIGDYYREAVELTNYNGGNGIQSFENYGHIFSMEYNAVIIDRSSVDNFLNYARIESTKFQPLLVGKNSSIINFHVSPLTRFVSAQDKPVFWSSDANAGALKKIVFGGSGSDPKGNVDDIEKVIFGNNSIGDFMGLKTWQVGGELGGDHDDDDVVWEFGGEGAYGKVSGATIDIVRGTAILTSNQGFGDGFDVDEIDDNEELGKVFIRDKGALDINDHSVTIDDIQIKGGTLEVKGTLKVKDLAFEDGTINAYVAEEGVDAPIQIKNGGMLEYGAGTLNVLADSSDKDPEGVWNIVDGDVSSEVELAKNTVLIVDGKEYGFSGLGEDNAVDGASAVYQGYLKPGSMSLVIEVKEAEGIIEDLNPNAGGNGGGIDDGITGDKDSDIDKDGIPDEKDPDDDGDGELDQLTGCEVGDDLCDVISDISGDEDEAWEEEEEVAVEIIEGVIDGLEDESIDLPLGFDYGQLARLVGSGLAPRNVDAAGRGLTLHNNLLVDTLFDRQPLRQFEELLVGEEVVEESVTEEEAVIEEAAPAQPLWLKTDELSDGEAAEYVEGAVEGVEVAEVEVADAAGNGEAAVAIDVEEDAVVIEFDGVSFVDQQDDELDLAKRDGVSAWVKGFGGNSRADESSILYNDYDLNAYGTSVGVDVALSESFQIGAYANYGDLNVHQRSGDTGGGSWNPEGWGGGLTAQYSTRHFYVQGLLGASEFSGEQSRNILQINDDLGGNTARGDKSVTSYLGALRIGAPFKTGGVVLEPQGQVVWTRNEEQGFSETRGTEKNLRLKYKSRTTNFAETELGMKLSVPIRTGDRALLVPSLRAAWLADWNQANEGQEIGYKFTNKTVDFESQLGTENGALIEAGLDYTVQNFNGVSVKLYGRGGMEFWASDRGTTWRASGGVTFQF